MPISDGLVRAVVDRVGRRAEGAEAAALQQKLRASPATPSALVVVQTDGSMVPTRGDQAWREAKLAVLYRAEHHVRGESGVRGQVTEARYVAVLGSQDEFRPALDTTVCEELTACMVGATPAQREALEGLHRYYSTNAARMRYAELRERDLPIGTGTVESGHRHVFQDRMKRSGQHWDVVHGHRLVQLRAAYKTAGPERICAAVQTAPRRTLQQARAA